MSSENNSRSVYLNTLRPGEIVYVHHSLFIGKKVDDNAVKKGMPGYKEKPDNTYFPARMTEDGLILDRERQKQDVISGKVAEREQVAYAGNWTDLEDFFSGFADRTAMNESLHDMLNSGNKNVREKTFEFLVEKNKEIMKRSVDEDNTEFYKNLVSPDGLDWDSYTEANKMKKQMEPNKNIGISVNEPNTYSFKMRGIWYLYEEGSSRPLMSIKTKRGRF